MTASHDSDPGDAAAAWSVVRTMAEGFALHEIILDGDGKPSDYRFLLVNPAWEAQTGLKAEDVIGRTVLEVLPGTEPVWIERYGEVAMTGVPIRFEEYARELGRHFEISAYSPAPGRFVSMGRDITKRKLDEEALRKGEHRLRRLFDQDPDGIVILDPETARPIEFNTTAHAQLGYTREEFAALTVADIEDVESPEDTRAHIDTVLREGRADFETGHRTKSGEIRHIRVTAQMVDVEGQLVYHCIWRDITDHRRLEDALQQRLVALTEPPGDTTGVTFSDLFDVEQIQSIQDAFSAATGVASIITEPDGTPITRPSNYSRLCTEVIQGTEKGRANCRSSDASIGCEDGSGPVIRVCKSAGLWDAGASIHAGGAHVANWLIAQVRNEDLDEEHMLAYADEIGADREEFKAALAEIPTMSSERFGLIAEMLSKFASELSVVAYQNVQQARFIIERERAEEELRSLNESLEDRVAERTQELDATVADLTEANLAKTRFLRSMSHELRTPLNSIIGFSSLLADGVPGGVNDEQRRQLAMVNNSGQHLLALINDILDLSRIEAGQVELRATTFEVAPLLADVLSGVAPDAEAKGLELTLDATDAPAGMDSDPTRMRQVLLNLLVNAIKFTDAGSVALRCYRPRAGLVAFSVQDTGPGITPEEQERVFDEFERGELVDTGVEGTGLGLPISRGLAEALGGRLEMASEVGVGSTFTLVLPEATVPAVRRDRQGGARPARA